MSRFFRSHSLADWLFRAILAVLVIIWFVHPPQGRGKADAAGTVVRLSQ